MLTIFVGGLWLGVHAARVGAVCAMGHGHGDGLGGTHHHADSDFDGLGVALAGDLLPGQPWTFLPHSSRLYFRRSQLPHQETFRTKTQWAVELLQQADGDSQAPVLAVFDGAYATSPEVGRIVAQRTGAGLWTDAQDPLQADTLPVGRQWTRGRGACSRV